MAIILPIERKTWKARIILSLIYFILTIGAITMVWPFLIMISGAAANRYDYHRYSPYLKSIFSEHDRFMRVMAGFHQSFPKEFYPDAPEYWSNWAAISRDEQAVEKFANYWLDGLQNEKIRQLWERRASDFHSFNSAYTVTNSICAFDERDIASFVSDRYETLDKLNESWDIRYTSFYSIRMRAQQRMPMHHPDWDWQDDPKNNLYQDFKQKYKDETSPQNPYSRTIPYCIQPLWERWLEKHGVAMTSNLFPPEPSHEWRKFVRTAYPKRLLRIKNVNHEFPAWQRHLEKICKTPAGYAKLSGEPEPKSLKEIPLQKYQNSVLWRTFVTQVPLENLETLSPEAEWHDFLKTKYQTIENVKQVYEKNISDWRQIKIPFAEAFAITYANNSKKLLFNDISSNYRTVCETLFVRGSVFANTLILVLLTVIATLTVNPIAAYALSRFHLKQTEAILLFLIATMAFPTAVTAIPGFILIRELGLLNTFAALVLPTAANGLSIFILKGFFDALPRELYEAATIDGASEWQIFRYITLPMTSPILAVNALNAFVSAYNSWEWALLVCQKQSHWTIAVWMYQLSQQFVSSPWMIMAGFVLVSIPTAIIFLLCQRVIMRGIVLPSMK